MNRQWRVWTLAGALWAGPVQAALDVVELHHRSAEELLPLIQPMLAPGEGASGTAQRLLLRAPEAHLRELREAVRALDVAPRQLRVQLLQDVDEDTAQHLLGLERDEGVLIASTRTARSGHAAQEVRVLEGHEARFKRNRSEAVAVSPPLSGVPETVQFREAEQGFWVRPRLNGETVTLEVGALSSQFADAQGALTGAEAETTVSAPLGTWVRLGGESVRTEVESGTLSTRGVAHRRAGHAVLLRVDRVAE